MIYRFALITGATRGIGAAFAAELPDTTHLMLVARDEDALKARQAELVRPGRTVEIVAADLSTPEGRRTVIDRAGAAGIDLLVNNAGIGRFGRFLENDEEAETTALELNVVATTVLTRALLPGMIDRASAQKRRAGVILLSSTVAFQPVPYLAVYSAGKSYVLAFGEALASELARRPVDLLVLCPRATRTSFGEESGFSPRRLPGAQSPRTVAREGLSALGRRTVHVCGVGTRTALTPLLVNRRILTNGIGAVMGLVARRAQGGARHGIS